MKGRAGLTLGAALDFSELPPLAPFIAAIFTAHIWRQGGPVTVGQIEHAAEHVETQLEVWGWPISALRNGEIIAVPASAFFDACEDQDP